MLLDTCALLWLAHEQKNINMEVLEWINESPVVYTSAISAFEISLKHKVGKLYLPVPPRQWFQEITIHHNIKVINLDEEICIRATELPDIHKDPCDRFIIATALNMKVPVVTSDKRFKDYGVEVFI